jgi:hypothetical protein
VKKPCGQDRVALPSASSVKARSRRGRAGHRGRPPSP